jgi:hypothetical protein
VPLLPSLSVELEETFRARVTKPSAFGSIDAKDIEGEGSSSLDTGVTADSGSPRVVFARLLFVDPKWGSERMAGGGESGRFGKLLESIEWDLSRDADRSHGSEEDSLSSAVDDKECLERDLVVEGE